MTSLPHHAQPSTEIETDLWISSYAVLILIFDLFDYWHETTFHLHVIH